MRSHTTVTFDSIERETLKVLDLYVHLGMPTTRTPDGRVFDEGDPRRRAVLAVCRKGADHYRDAIEAAIEGAGIIREQAERETKPSYFLVPGATEADLDVDTSPVDNGTALFADPAKMVRTLVEQRTRLLPEIDGAIALLRLALVHCTESPTALRKRAEVAG